MILIWLQGRNPVHAIVPLTTKVQLHEWARLKKPFIAYMGYYELLQSECCNGWLTTCVDISRTS